MLFVLCLLVKSSISCYKTVNEGISFLVKEQIETSYGLWCSTNKFDFLKLQIES